jgi:hypothetical protein
MADDCDSSLHAWVLGRRRHEIHGSLQRGRRGHRLTGIKSVDGKNRISIITADAKRPTDLFERLSVTPTRLPMSNDDRGRMAPA